jgi:hypothetical protein
LEVDYSGATSRSNTELKTRIQQMYRIVVTAHVYVVVYGLVGVSTCEGNPPFRSITAGILSGVSTAVGVRIGSMCKFRSAQDTVLSSCSVFLDDTTGVVGLEGERSGFGGSYDTKHSDKDVSEYLEEL